MGRITRREIFTQAAIAIGLPILQSASKSFPKSIHSATDDVDTYGGLLRIHGKKTGFFHPQKIDNRWWVITPDGHGMWIRAVSKVSVSDYGGNGGFLPYEAVHLQNATGAISPNLASEAADSREGDILFPSQNHTVQNSGDAIYIGSSKFKPNFTYFLAHQWGSSGEISWSYLSSNGWIKINGNGSPFRSEAPSPKGMWNLDTGGYLGPDANGFGVQNNPMANRITWWDMKTGFPKDFNPVKLPFDSSPKYYIKGVVIKPYDTPPILNQIYERATLEEAIARKYQPGDYRQKWAQRITERLKVWGFNASGQYSDEYVTESANLSNSLPTEPTWQLGGWAINPKFGYHVKSVYQGAVFPPASHNLLYQGIQPDVFDPNFEKAYNELVIQRKDIDIRRSWCLIPEEGDYLFGMNTVAHDHMGYVILSKNPWQPHDIANSNIPYFDPQFHAKYALRDFLRYRYRDKEDNIPRLTETSRISLHAYTQKPEGAELAALKNLNTAWGANYTTWGTSEGDLSKGTNAYGTGTGFMDENGSTVLDPSAKQIQFDQSFTKSDHPAIRKDLDDFIGFFTQRYGHILAQAFKQISHPPLFLELYDSPDIVYKAISPYLDGLEANVKGPDDALRIYNAARLPMVVTDYFVADPDSQLYFRAKISSIRYDPQSERTIVTAPGLNYEFRISLFIDFPEAIALNTTQRCGGKYLYPHPRITSVHGDTFEIPGDFTPCVKPGMIVKRWDNANELFANQEQRAKAMTERYESLLQLRGADGVRFVIGVEHWCLYDPSVSNWFDTHNFGICTLQDNAYDGVEAKKKSGADAKGYPVGGEPTDYGDLITPLSHWLRGVEK